MNLLIKNGRVVDPANNLDGKFDILVEGSKIKEVSSQAVASNCGRGLINQTPTIIDASNKLVVPGLIDVHVHFREFGKSEEKETIYSVSRAAAMGGFTTIICQPNIKPRVDSPAKVRQVINEAKKYSLVNLYPSACITKGRAHKELVDIKEIKEAGAVKLTDDGDPVIYETLMYNALKEAKKFNLPLSSHCGLSNWAELTLKKLGDQTVGSTLEKGYFYNSETFFVRRDIRLANKARCPLHIEHVSLKTSVDEIRHAKIKGYKITAEVTPHHFILSKNDLSKYGTNAKVNPPLREIHDIEALREALKDDTIDVIASDHAPHMSEDKNLAWEYAPFGIVGLETTLGLVLTELVSKNILSLSQAITKMTANPAKIFNLQAGSLGVGMPADITIIDLEKEYKVNTNQFESLGKNCPFNGWKLKGKAIATIVGGKVVMRDGKILS
ncbi:MAG: dihydroorotase [bacterium]|nr:dihydroorotase [bacterium]